MGSHALWHVPEVPTGTPEWVKVSTMPVIVNDWTCWEWQFDGQNGTAAEAADPRIWINGVEQTWGDTFVYPDRAAHPTQEKAGNFTTLEAGVRPVAAHPARVQVRVRVGPGWRAGRALARAERPVRQAAVAARRVAAAPSGQAAQAAAPVWVAQSRARSAGTSKKAPHPPAGPRCGDALGYARVDRRLPHRG